MISKISLYPYETSGVEGVFIRKLPLKHLFLVQELHKIITDNIKVIREVALSYGFKKISRRTCKSIIKDVLKSLSGNIADLIKVSVVTKRVNKKRLISNITKCYKLNKPKAKHAYNTIIEKIIEINFPKPKAVTESVTDETKKNGINKDFDIVLNICSFFLTNTSMNKRDVLDLTLDEALALQEKITQQMYKNAVSFGKPLSFIANGSLLKTSSGVDTVKEEIEALIEGTGLKNKKSEYEKELEIAKRMFPDIDIAKIQAKEGINVV
jgi:hypothetical protein